MTVPSPGHDPLQAIFRELRKLPDAAPEWPRFAGYEIKEDLGEGGFGVVYRARDLTLERDVALKVLKPRPGADQAAEERFLNEARALARVRHPNVLVIYGVIEEGGRRALSLELIEGETLSGIIDRDGSLAPLEALGTASDIAHALEAVHAAGVVHRDVKTSNVIREKGGRAVLADFGLGAFLERETEPGRRAYAAGAPAFMAPEQIRGDPVDARTDVYALGAFLHHALSGRPPFSGQDVEEVIRGVLAGGAPSLDALRADIPPGTAALVSRAMAAEPSQRFQSAREMAGELEGILRAAQSGASRAANRRQVVVGLAIVAALAVGATLALGRIRGIQQDGVDFRIEAAARLREGVRLELQANRDAHVYILHEDARGRKYLLHPTRETRAGSALSAGERQTLPPASGWQLAAEEEPGWIVAIAALEAIGPLEDTIPQGGSSGETGKDGYPRLKPVTVRGLQRVLAERGRGEMPGAGEQDEPFALADLAERLREGKSFGGEASRVWLGKVRLPPRLD